MTEKLLDYLPKTANSELAIFIIILIALSLAIFICLLFAYKYFKRFNKTSRRQPINHGKRRSNIFQAAPETKGKIGERSVQLQIGQNKENEQYVINDYIIEKDGKSSQIDHIVVNKKGVFVIETKNYSGNIYGKDEQLEWTQVLAYGNEKNKLYNPLKQNRTHIYRLRKIIGNVPIKSLVVFTGDCILNVNSPDVIKLWQLRSKLSYGDDVLNATQIKDIYTKIVNSRSNISTTEHIANVKKQKREIENFICPRCGKPLVFKNGKYGEFFGCSNYPNCKFIRKIDKK